MSTAEVQGALWGAQARDYACLTEGMFRPVYERVFDEVGLGKGTRLLDVGCGPGLAAHIAAGRGARVSGLDAAENSIAIARERTPDGNFRIGDMEQLPWCDAAFDVVTGFNAFQFAADLPGALREAARVTVAGGRVAMVVWGPPEECATPTIVAAVMNLLPPRPPGAQNSVPLSAPGRLHALLEQAGLTPLSGGEIECRFEFADLETAIRGMMSAGAVVSVVQRVGAEPVRQAIADSLARFRTDKGTYHQRNQFLFAVASA